MTWYTVDALTSYSNYYTDHHKSVNRKRSEVIDPCLKQCIICILKGEPGPKYSAKLRETELMKLGKSTEGV